MKSYIPQHLIKYIRTLPTGLKLKVLKLSWVRGRRKDLIEFAKEYGYDINGNFLEIVAKCRDLKIISQDSFETYTETYHVYTKQKST